MPDQIVVVKEWDHFHMDAVQEPGLMDRNVDRMVSCFYEKIGFFWGLDLHWQKDGPSTGSADTKITVPFIDKIYHFGKNSDLAQAGAVIGIGMHDAVIIGRLE